MSEAIIDEFYDANDDTWNLTSDLLREINGDLQILIDCARSESTIFLEAGLKVEVTSTLKIEKPLNIVGDDDDIPIFSCPEGDQILTIE